MKTYPDIRLEVSSLDRKIDLLGDGFDLVIRIGILADSNLVARKIGSCPRVIVTSPEYLKAHGAPAGIEELKDHNCLVYTDLATVNIWHFWYQGKEHSIQVKGTMQSNCSDAILECVLAGIGIAVMPNWLIQPQLDSGNLVPILAEFVPTEFPINAVYPRNNYIPLKVRCFINYMKEAYLQNPVLQAPK